MGAAGAAPVPHNVPQTARNVLTKMGLRRPDLRMRFLEEFFFTAK
jgi:hypothetical protein